MNITELKALAEKAAGWKLDATMQTDDDRDEGIAFVGATNDEGIFSDVARIDTGLYYQPDKAIEVANFYAAANPAEILELIAKLEDAQGEIRALRATEAGLRDRLAAVEADRAQRVSDTLCDDDLSDLAHSANQEALSFGLSHDVFLRYFKEVRRRLLASTPAQPAQQPKPSQIKAEHTTVYPSGTTVTRLELTDEAKESLRADVPHIPGQPVERKPMTDEQAVKCIEAAGFKTWTSAHFRLVKEAENHHGIKE